MQRCLDLAQLGMGQVAPNPMVGAVLVHRGMIIGEGYHRKWGGPHAEVNCLQSLSAENQHLVREATLYVSLEPCAHFGKTPPCADLIIRMKIPRVVIGCRDPFAEVNGRGIEKLQAAGVEVVVGILEQECQELNKRFFTFHTKHRPFIILKWAQTADARIATADQGRLLISNAQTNRLVHRWRSEEMSIAVGTRTAMADDPALNTRLWPGKNPVRIVVDRALRLPATLQLLDGSGPTIVFNTLRHSMEQEGTALQNKVYYYQVSHQESLVPQLLRALYELGIQSLLVEGGAFLLQSFIREDLWDEARIITNEEMVIGEGLSAPTLKKCRWLQSHTILSDTIRIYQPIQVS
ncbi:MAG: bifunctional diaminohydroxyphosphoribosylaminopyrimidine deaminase/5-amino-6-(5-phosphoribosylamino)uracil reductase RibD [Flavisolibacter sp.]